MTTYYDQSGLDRLYGEAFSGAAEVEISASGLLQLDKIYSGSFPVSRDGMSWEAVELYRSPQGDGMILVWGFGDGGNMSASRSKGPCIIPAEAGEALVNGLKALQPVDEQPGEFTWNAEDAGMMDSQPRLRDLYRSADTPGPNQERDAEALKKLREKIEAANEDFGWSDDGEINRRKQLFSLPILVLVVAMLGLGLFTANTRRDMWTFAVASAVLDIPSLTFLILTIARPKTQQGRVRSIWIAVLATVVIVAAGILLSLGRGL